MRFAGRGIFIDTLTLVSYSFLTSGTERLNGRRSLKLEKVKLIFAIGENVMSFIEECWCSKTKWYKRRSDGGELDIKGGRNTLLTIESRGKKQDIVLIGLPEGAKAEDIAAIAAEYSLDENSEEKALLIGTIKEMRCFLPREPRVGARYQPIIGVQGVYWGILIRRKEESILKIAPKEPRGATSFMNELVALVWNIGRELAPEGKLRIAKKMYEGTWRDPWAKPYGCGLRCSECGTHHGKFF